MAEGRSDHPTSAPAISVHASSFTNMLDLLGNPRRVDPLATAPFFDLVTPNC